MKTIIPLSIICFALMVLLITGAVDLHRHGIFSEREEETSGALQALEFWSRPRAYPGTEIPSGKYYRAYETFIHQVRATAKQGILPAPPWESLGPLNAQGRCITMAINPKNNKSIYVGTASGGLWHGIIQYDTLGFIKPGWQRVQTGFPVLGVKAIAIDSADTNIIYIGTGEVYKYQNSRGGVAIRTTRGSFGMGILKTTDAGTTWSKSLDWSYSDERGVQAIRINPYNHNTVFAATSEGILRSQDAGASWVNVLDTLMGEDILINSSDTNNILVSCGNFATPGAGLYSSIDGGASWFPVTSGIPMFSGKAVFEQSGSDPNTVYASIADSTTGVGGFYKSSTFGWSWQAILVITDPGMFGSIYGAPGSGQGWYSHYIAVHPTDPNKLIFGGVKLARSIDGGHNFLGAGNAHDDHHYHAHDPKDPNVFYEVNDAGIVRSTDFGATFEDIGYGLVSTQFYNGFANSATDSTFALGQMQDNIPGWVYQGTRDWGNANIDEVGWSAIDPTNANVVYAATRAGEAVTRSTNHAVSFPQTSFFTGEGAWNAPLVVSPSNPAVLYFGKTTIYKSTNASINWQATPGSTSLDGNPALSMAVSATNPDTVYIGTAPIYGRPHLYNTTNGGTDWNNITGSLPDRYPMDLGVDPSNSATVYAVFGGYSAGHVFKSIDAGATWANITGTLPDVNTSAVIVDPANPAHVYIGNDIGVFASTDAGASWFPFSDGLPEAVIVSNLGICTANQSLRASTHGSGLFQRKLMSTITGVGSGTPPAVPLRTSIGRNYPNPFNPSTLIHYTVGSQSMVTIRIYDIAGREVTTLVQETKPPGSYDVRWDASAYGGMPSGVYFCRLTAGGVDQSIKMMLMK